MQESCWESALHFDEQPVVYSSADELVTDHNWSAHECKVKVMNEMLPTLDRKCKRVVGKVPSTWMSNRLCVLPWMNWLLIITGRPMNVK